MKEDDIIQGLIQKDEKAFREFVDTHRQMVVNTCYGLIHVVEDAEDVAQEVFIEVYRSIGKFKGKSKISTWVYRIAVNRSLNFLRDNKKHSWLQSFDDKVKSQSQKLFQMAAGDEGHPDFNVESSQRAMLLHEAVDSLPKNQRVAFTLNKYEDLSTTEIAEIMELSVSSVESLIHRAKKSLQKKLYLCYKNKCI